MAGGRSGSLSEPGPVSFLQSQPDLSHHLVHFSVRQGALGASESQGECDALVPLLHLPSMVFIKRPRCLQEIAEVSELAPLDDHRGAAPWVEELGRRPLVRAWGGRQRDEARVEGSFQLV